MVTIPLTRPHPAVVGTTGRVTGGGTPDYTAHTARYGPLPALAQPRELIGLIDASGLLGRGGAGFPTARKMAAVTGRGTVVIANGAEGEPASRKDVYLLENAPHLVLDGLELAAAAVGARELHLYAGAALLPLVRRALDERPSRGRRQHTVQLTEAPDTFIAGEESAVLSRIEGRPALPRDRVVITAASGLRGHPTLVQNVETLAHIGLIARYGPTWFRSLGTPADPGTMLVTLSGAVRDASVVEVPLGIALDRLLLDHAHTPPAHLRAVLLGGFHWAWIPANALAQTSLSRQSLQRHHASPGAGVVSALAADECGLRSSADITAYLAQQSAGQCGPCINGLPRLADVLNRLAYGPPEPGLDREVHRLLRLVDGRGSCRHPDGTARFIRSALTVFASDIPHHLRGRCEAGSTTIPSPGPR